MDADLHERIRRRAYELWEQDGRPEGRAEEHRRQAAAELEARAEAAGVPPGGGDDHRDGQARERAPGDLAADEAAEGGGGVGPNRLGGPPSAPSPAVAARPAMDYGDPATSRTDEAGCRGPTRVSSRGPSR